MTGCCGQNIFQDSSTAQATAAVTTCVQVSTCLIVTLMQMLTLSSCHCKLQILWTPMQPDSS